MNLTSKRMLQFIMVCAGVSALTASADPTLFVADSFEAPEGSAEQSIVEYKWVVDGQTTTTNWFMADGDGSKLEALDNSAASVGGKGRPFAIADKNLVLKLETEGQTLSRILDNSVIHDFVTGDPVYVDTLIKFTPSEDDPTIEDPNVKIAVFVNAQSNLVLYTGKNLSINEIGTTDTGLPIDPEAWYRLTIMLGQLESTPVVQVYLNGEVISSADGMDETGAAGGTWFLSAAGLAPSLSMVSFQGTGWVDELVVTSMANGFDVTPPSILLTLSFDDAMVSVMTGGVAVANLAQVPTDTAVVITAMPWYQITNPGGLFIGGDTTNTFDTMITAINGTVSSAVAATNTIVAEMFSSTAGLPAGFGGLAINDVAGWAIDNNLAPAEMTEAMLDDYLFNVAPGTDAKPEIKSIAVNGESATITVGATSTAVNFENLHGTLTIYTTDDLVTPFAEIGTFAVTLTTTDLVTITVPIGDGKFIKAVLK